MRVVDERFLEYIRNLPCIWCGMPPPSDPAHIYARGLGSGSRLDTPLNVVLWWAEKLHEADCEHREDLRRRIKYEKFLEATCEEFGAIHRFHMAARDNCGRSVN